MPACVTNRSRCCGVRAAATRASVKRLASRRFLRSIRQWWTRRDQRLQGALGRLPEEQRTALTLAYYGNQTHVEIAERLGVPLGTIKSRISMAMRKLQTELASPGGNRS